MTELAEKLIQQALDLPADERAQVAERLLTSLEPPLSDLDELWAQKVEERIDAFERGDLEAIPAEDLINSIESRDFDFSRGRNSIDDGKC